VYICKKKVMRLVKNGDPKNRKVSEGANSGMSCSKDGCGAVKTNSSVGTNRQNVGGAKGLSSKPQYGSKTITKKQAEKRAVKMAEYRAKAQPKSNRSKY